MNNYKHDKNKTTLLNLEISKFSFNTYDDKF